MFGGIAERNLCLVRLKLLHKMSGSNGVLKRFRLEVKNIAKADSLPDYRVHYDANSDQVMFYTKDRKALAESMKSSEQVSSDNESPE
jgi:hypothetical protein